MTPSTSLLMLVPRIGGPSETFVARHIDHLSPGRTLVLARELVPQRAWHPSTEVRLVGGRRLVPHGSFRWRLAARISLRRRSSAPMPASERWHAALASALADLDADVPVLAEYLDVWAELLSSSDLGGRRVVVRAHGYDVSERILSPAWVDAYKRLADTATIAPVSEYSRDVLLDAGLPAERVVCVPNGVDLTMFSVRPPSDEPATSGTLRVISVGRLVDKKDPRTTLEAVRLARDAGVEAFLTIVGDGPLRSAIERRVKELGLQDAVVMQGAVSHELVRELLSEAHVFVQHSQRAPSGDEEGMPVSVLEAMASGLPVVATRHSGITEVLDGGAGELVEPGDAEGMSRALLRLRDLASRERQARRGRERVERSYSWEHEANGLRGLLGLP